MKIRYFLLTTCLFLWSVGGVMAEEFTNIQVTAETKIEEQLFYCANTFEKTHADCYANAVEATCKITCNDKEYSTVSDSTGLCTFNIPSSECGVGDTIRFGFDCRGLMHFSGGSTASCGYGTPGGFTYEKIITSNEVKYTTAVYGDYAYAPLTYMKESGFIAKPPVQVPEYNALMAGVSLAGSLGLYLKIKLSRI